MKKTLNKRNLLIISALTLLISGYSVNVQAKPVKYRLIKPTVTTTPTPANNYTESKTKSGKQTSTSQEFKDPAEELNTKMNAYTSNAKAFSAMAKGLNASNDKPKPEQIKDMAESIDAMLKNNTNLQELTRKIAQQQQKDQQKNYYMREIMPNLQNSNRQLIRIQNELKSSSPINTKNILYQADRIEQSSQQVIDRLKNVPE